MKFSIKNLIKRGTEQGQDSLGGNIKHFDFCEFRERDWSNILTCQDKSTSPYLWQTSNHSIAKIAIEQPQDKHSLVTAVAVSMCGNFGLLGYESG
jgi:hypothetical protein